MCNVNRTISGEEEEDGSGTFFTVDMKSSRVPGMNERVRVGLRGAAVREVKQSVCPASSTVSENGKQMAW